MARKYTHFGQNFETEISQFLIRYVAPKFECMILCLRHS